MNSQISELLFDDSTRGRITFLLQDLGIPANINGYYYLREAILCAYAYHSHLTHSDMRRIYLETALLCKTTSPIIKRSISHAIKVSGRRGNDETIARIFGIDVHCQEWKVPNKEYISKIANHLKTAPPQSELKMDKTQVIIFVMDV